MLLLLAARCYAVAVLIAGKSEMGTVRGVYLLTPPGYLRNLGRFMLLEQFFLSGAISIREGGVACMQFLKDLEKKLCAS